jgi:RHS repeat-associated protein
LNTIAELGTSNQTERVRVNYQALAESPSIAQVQSITDNYASHVCNYRYNEDNLPCGYSVRRNGGTVAMLNVTQTEHGRTQYALGSTEETFETEIVYDSNIAENPRITDTKLYLASSNSNWFRDREAEDFRVSYDYDGLGRLERKKYRGSTRALPLYPELIVKNANTEYKYVPGTTLVESQTTKYTVINTRTNNIAYTYDSRGNVLTANETFSGGTLNLSFDYDNNDRVAGEIFIRNNVLDKQWAYVYTNNGVDTGRVERIVHSGTGALIRSFSYNALGQLLRAGSETTDRTYDPYGNCINISGVLLSYTRGNLLSRHRTNDNIGAIITEYEYNHQGVRFRKVVSVEGGSASQTDTYFYDGDKLLGENRSNNVRLRYVYDAGGLCGVRHSTNNGSSYTNYLYQKDALGNITGITRTGFDGDFAQVCRYTYTAFGECTVRNPNGTAGSFAATHIANVNPFRWKGHYFDTCTGWYYINGRWYDQIVCGYVTADRPENLLLNAGAVGGLNRYGITIDNPVALLAAIYTIFTVSMLYVDDSFVRSRTWWERVLRWLGNNGHWVRLGITALALLVFGVAAAATGGAAIPLMLKAATGGAISGLVLGGTIGGIMAAVGGGSVRNGILDGAVNGAIMGASMAVVFAGIAGIVGAIKAAKAKAAGSAATQPSIGVGDTVGAQNAAVQPKNASTMVDILGDGGVGFETVGQLKAYLKQRGINMEGMELHHIVEQLQIGKGSITATQVQNTNNVILLKNGVHGQISGHYSSNIIGGGRLRYELIGKNLDVQLRQGKMALARVGVFI